MRLPGIRFFDVRLAVNNGVLQAYHGYLQQHATLPDILRTISQFLTARPRETLVLCIQQEHPSTSPLFSQFVRRDMEEYIARGEWFLENRVPRLGEVRGRGVLMSRFGGSLRDGGEAPWVEEIQAPGIGQQQPPEPHYYEGESFSLPTPSASTASPFPYTSHPTSDATTFPAPRIAHMGWKPEIWPNSSLDGFTWHAQETPCRTQDWYALLLPSSSFLADRASGRYEIYGFFNIPAKFNLVRPLPIPLIFFADVADHYLRIPQLTDHLLASSHFPPGKNLTISFASASSIPLALPPVIANGLGFPRWGMGFRGVNERFKEFLLDRLAWEELRDKEEVGGLLRGIVPMDYYKDSGVVELMVALNVVQAQR